MNAVFTISDEHRPCYVNGEKAIFHRYTYDTKFMSDGQFHEFLFAIVEYADGHVQLVEPTDVVFADGGEFKEFTFFSPEELKARF